MMRLLRAPRPACLPSRPSGLVPRLAVPQQGCCGPTVRSTYAMNAKDRRHLPSKCTRSAPHPPAPALPSKSSAFVLCFERQVVCPVSSPTLTPTLATHPDTHSAVTSLSMPVCGHVARLVACCISSEHSVHWTHPCPLLLLLAHARTCKPCQVAADVLEGLLDGVQQRQRSILLDERCVRHLWRESLLLVCCGRMIKYIKYIDLQYPFPCLTPGSRRLSCQPTRQDPHRTTITTHSKSTTGATPSRTTPSSRAGTTSRGATSRATPLPPSTPPQHPARPSSSSSCSGLSFCFP